MSIVVCIFGKMARPKHTTHVRLVIRQRAITAAIAVSRGLEGPRQRGVSSRRIATLIQSMAKTYQHSRWLWALFDDGGTALTTTAVTPREQPPGSAR